MPQPPTNLHCRSRGVDRLAHQRGVQRLLGPLGLLVRGRQLLRLLGSQPVERQVRGLRHELPRH